MALRHYGLKVGDKVTINSDVNGYRGKVFEVIYLYPLDNNAVRLRGEDGFEYTYTAEGCKKVNTEEKNIKE